MPSLMEWLKDHEAHKLGGTLVLLIICWFAWIAWRPSGGSPFRGRDVSELRLLDPQGNVRRVGDLRGRVVVLDFWATWCPPCRMALPEVAALQARQGDRYAVLPVSLDQGGFADVRPFLAANPQWGLFTVVPADPASLADHVGGIDRIPTTILLDVNGRVARSWTGYSPGRLEQELRGVLASSETAEPGRPGPGDGLAGERLLGMRGRDFLFFYPALVVLLLGLGLLMRRSVLDLGSRPPARIPDLYAVAYLRGRARGVLEVALTRLSVLGLLDVNLGPRGVPKDLALDPVELAVLNARGFHTVRQREHAFKVREANRLASYGRTLQAEGLIPDAAQVARCNRIRWTCALIALGLGGPGLAMAFGQGHTPFATFLVPEVILLSLLTLKLLAAPLTTPPGRALLARISGEVRHPLRMAREPGMDPTDPVPLSLAVAAMGRDALAGTPFKDLADHLRS